MREREKNNNNTWSVSITMTPAVLTPPRGLRGIGHRQIYKTIQLLANLPSGARTWLVHPAALGELGENLVGFLLDTSLPFIENVNGTKYNPALRTATHFAFIPSITPWYCSKIAHQHTLESFSLASYWLSTPSAPSSLSDLATVSALLQRCLGGKAGHTVDMLPKYGNASPSLL